MSCNYYLRENVCEHCGRHARELHIGKSSIGWTFLVATHEDLGIRTLLDWRARWDANGAEIRDEYGDEITPRVMLATITERGAGSRRHEDARPGTGTYDYEEREFC